MKFYDILTHYSHFRQLGQKGTYHEFYARVITIAETHRWSMESNNLGAEFNWYQDKRPYYNIWPGIIPLFLTLKLDIDGGLIQPLKGSIGFRLPAERSPFAFEVEGQAWTIQTILASPSLICGKTGFSLFIDIDEKNPTDGSPAFTVRNFQAFKGQTLEAGLNNLPLHESATHGIIIPNDLLADCIRLVCGVCLLSQGDADLIQPVVFNKDLAKYETSKDQKYVDKARRQGTLGWHVGKDLERAPHFRKAHLAIYWTGKGRTTPIVKLRGADKPIIVHRDKVEKLPTDFLDRERSK